MLTPAGSYYIMADNKTVNTFTQRPVPTQILSYFVVLLEIIVYFACIYPNLQSLPARVTLTFLLCCFLLAVIGCTVSASLSDPTDSVVKEYRRSRSER